MIREWITVVFLLLGAVFMLLASIGLIRLPDVYTRIHATTKAPTLGLLLMLLSLCIQFTSVSTIFKILLILFFIFLTIPVASLMIGKAAYYMKTPPWKKTQRDDMKKQSDAS